FTDKEIKALKAKTKKFLKSVNWSNTNENPLFIPWNLLIIPEYQESRTIRAEEKVNNIVASWDSTKMIPGIVNYRTNGKYKDLLFIVDGYHRSRAMERLSDDLGFEGSYDIIRNLEFNKEVEIFGDQYENCTKVSTLHRFYAWLMSNDMTNKNVAAAHYMNEILNKYHLDTAISGNKSKNYEKIAVMTGIKICIEDLIKGNNAFDWIIEILKTSGACATKKGLSYNMLTALYGTYYMIIDGRFEDLSLDSAKEILIKYMRKNTYGTIQDLGTAILMEKPNHILSTTSISRAKAVFAYWICKDSNQKAYGYN
ncbi:MAG: ParB/Srx family N-terminal domain-containing protein, partial [Bacteroidaceae bacterium]|nr:ParB/Srx family N-terminal domain-containing protein [Bacteroidaceae bacterium]